MIGEGSLFSPQEKKQHEQASNTRVNRRFRDFMTYGYNEFIVKLQKKSYIQKQISQLSGEIAFKILKCRNV